LRQSHLKPRQWFAVGDLVKVVAIGPGYRVGSQGQAQTPGLEGQAARIKMESGRTLTGMPVADRLVELPL
jgi:flagella basal body P-ring formation protein FlgA